SPTARHLPLAAERTLPSRRTSEWWLFRLPSSGAWRPRYAASSTSEFSFRPEYWPDLHPLTAQSPPAEACESEIPAPTARWPRPARVSNSPACHRSQTGPNHVLTPSASLLLFLRKWFDGPRRKRRPAAL